jgi:hypothetical protein
VKKAILAVPGDHPFAGQLADEARAKGLDSILAVPVIEGAEGPQARDAARRGSGAPEEGRTRIPYSRGSRISARTIFIEASAAYDAIDAAVFVYSPPPFPAGPFSQASPGEVEAFVDREIKGAMLLAREASSYFARRGRGALAFVLPEAGAEASAFEPLTRSLFKCLAQAAFDASTELMPAYGFQCSGGLDAAFARFLLKTLEDSPKKAAGRWHRYSGKGGIFGIF